MPLDEKKLGKESIFLSSDELKVDEIRTPAAHVAHLIEANGKVTLRANQDRYVKGDLATFDESKSIARIFGKPAKLYQQERPGAPYQESSADGYEYNKITEEFRAINSRGIHMK